jgi:hypothetical protein
MEMEIRAREISKTKFEEPKLWYFLFTLVKLGYFLQK